MLHFSVFFVYYSYMITSKQRKTLKFIEQYTLENGYSPTLKIIAESMGVKSPSTVHQHVKELIKKGYLSQGDNYGELLILEKNEPTLLKVPIIGTITAGQPIDVYEEVENDYIEAYNLSEHEEFFALNVAGDSMIDEGIFDGDVVIIKKQSSAQNGQTVVAIIDNEKATLKKLFRETNGFRLQPANQALLPLFREEVEVRGVVYEIRRRINNQTPKTAVKPYKTLDLFAGIGGIRLGFEKAGFETVFANDFEKSCSYTYDLNFETTKLTVEDIRKIDIDDLPKFDLLLGGFPCQAFSIAGHRQGFKDEKDRGNLFFDIAEILKKKQPTGFLLENVKNLKSHDNGNTFKVIEQVLKELGYHIKTKVLNSMDYGNVPQNRERIYIVGFKDKTKTEEFQFPEKIDLTTQVKDLLEATVGEKYYYDGKPLYNRIKNDVNEEGQVYQWRRQYVRKNKKEVCPTLTANMGMGGHNVPIIKDKKGIRKLTPRECFRLQGFPDDFKLPKNLADSALYKQAGNSVTVPVIERIAESMMKVL